MLRLISDGIVINSVHSILMRTDSTAYELKINSLSALYSSLCHSYYSFSAGVLCANGFIDLLSRVLKPSLCLVPSNPTSQLIIITSYYPFPSLLIFVFVQSVLRDISFPAQQKQEFQY